MPRKTKVGMTVESLGSYLREQRVAAELSLRQLAEHQVRLDQYLVEVSIRYGQAPKASVIRGLCCFGRMV